MQMIWRPCLQLDCKISVRWLPCWTNGRSRFTSAEFGVRATSSSAHSDGCCVTGIFEQYIATEKQIQIEIIMPAAEASSLQAALTRGELASIKQKFDNIDVQNAKASVEDGDCCYFCR